MRKILLSTLILLILLNSCSKFEQTDKFVNNKEQFVEPTNSDEINRKVKLFIQTLNNSDRSFSLVQANYSTDEVIWLIEAGLNYTYDELEKNVKSEMHLKDSFLLENNSISVSSALCESIYNQFSNAIQRVKDEDSMNVIRIIDIDIRNNYITMDFVYGYFEEGTRGLSDPYFLSSESYYAFDLINYVWTSGNPFPPSPGPNNAASKIQTKLRFRNSILFLPAGSYWTSVTGWEPQSDGGGIGITTSYYSQFCTAPTLKLWGSPGLEACYKGFTESNMLGYNYLNFLLDEADNRISYLPAPAGKQVSHIEYYVSHWGQQQNTLNTTPCLGQWEYSSAFRWKYGILAYDR